MTTKCGYIAIIGRPNVGKSTLLNALLEKKLSITSNKPQTTRQSILGIKTIQQAQLIFMDTPGLHAPKSQFKLMNQHLNKNAMTSLREADIVMWMIEAEKFTSEDTLILEKLAKLQEKNIKHKKNQPPLFIVINKIDQLRDQNSVLLVIEKLSEACNTFSLAAEFIPISAEKKQNLKKLEKLIIDSLPESPFYFDENALTDRDDNFVAAEMIREKLVRFLGQELPYATTVSIQSMQSKLTVKQEPIIHLSAIIWVEKEGQKKIIIGENGSKLKQIGAQARLALENYFDKKIFLQLWVKVKSGWSENPLLLKQILQ
jgi:GTP-binding protein Era